MGGVGSRGGGRKPEVTKMFTKYQLNNYNFKQNLFRFFATLLMLAKFWKFLQKMFEIFSIFRNNWANILENLGIYICTGFGGKAPHPEAGEFFKNMLQIYGK